jgi:hypothetical protein
MTFWEPFFRNLSQLRFVDSERSSNSTTLHITLHKISDLYYGFIISALSSAVCLPCTKPQLPHPQATNDKNSGTICNMFIYSWT